MTGEPVVVGTARARDGGASGETAGSGPGDAARPADGAPGSSPRPRVAGKFLAVGDRKLFVKGVTYGTFRPNGADGAYGGPDVVARDFGAMAAHGVNAVRVYTVPPPWLLDEAQRHDLRVMVGIPWEQHVAFLDDAALARRIEGRVRSGVEACAGHPAVLCYAIGNEIPAPIVRWHGRVRIERFIRRLHATARDVDPEALVTYVNYPTTEYLQLPFLDFTCFNVYLEDRDRLAVYLARLQNIAADRPLVMAEVGLDSLRNGLEEQSRSLDWQLRTAFASGCAGSFVFSWTDEWHRGGHDVEDWAFGLTTRERAPKPALAAVQRVYAGPTRPECPAWPRVSVVVCVHNGSRTIGECLAGLARLDYPDFEVIVVDDGSTDRTAEIAGRFDVRLIRIENGGLSNARNVGMRAATGELVAYIDDDAWPDPDWLTHLAQTFLTTDHAGVGGPNIPPEDDGPTAACIACAPGGPSHVLASEREVEHVPGCNMAFRRDALERLDGFDRTFRIAGDDVDLCWRLSAAGMTLGFNPAAVVWHHRRHSVRGYLRQQLNYGRAEAMLERKWPEKYNRLGHVRWNGQLYGHGNTVSLFTRPQRIYHGVWGTAPFQSLYGCSGGMLPSLPLMPEWYILAASLGALAIASVGATSFWIFAPLVVAACVVSVVQAGINAARAPVGRPRRLLVMFLHLAQPAVRLAGRLSFGLTPWRRRGDGRPAYPGRRAAAIWSERWRSSEQWLRALEAAIRGRGALVRRGGAFDRWDLEVRGGLLGSVRVLTGIEEHGEGRQLVRCRTRPWIASSGGVLIVLLAALAIVAGLIGDTGPGVVLACASAALVVVAVGDCARATGTVLAAVEATEP
ncbi:MAG: glycosyltransferase [Planctomycetota bacterium]|jgi:GT2 family glycosyltransferase